MDSTSHLHSLGKRAGCKINAFGERKTGEMVRRSTCLAASVDSDASCYSASAEPAGTVRRVPEGSKTYRPTKTLGPDVTDSSGEGIQRVGEARYMLWTSGGGNMTEQTKESGYIFVIANTDF